MLSTRVAFGGEWDGSNQALAGQTAAGGALFLLAAVLFLGGAANAAWHGLHAMMQVGLFGAALALEVVYMFCDWPPRSRRHNRR